MHRVPLTEGVQQAAAQLTEDGLQKGWGRAVSICLRLCLSSSISVVGTPAATSVSSFSPRAKRYQYSDQWHRLRKIHNSARYQASMRKSGRHNESERDSLGSGQIPKCARPSKSLGNSRLKNNINRCFSMRTNSAQNIISLALEHGCGRLIVLLGLANVQKKAPYMTLPPEVGRRVGINIAKNFTVGATNARALGPLLLHGKLLANHGDAVLQNEAKAISERILIHRPLNPSQARVVLGFQQITRFWLHCPGNVRETQA